MEYEESSFTESKVFAGLLCALFSVTLAITLFAAGFAACAFQPTTRLLSTLFSDFGTSVYLPKDTVDIAVATRDFTVNPYTQGESVAADELAQVILAAANTSSAKGSPKASFWNKSLQPQSPSSNNTQQQTSETLNEQAAIEDQGNALSLDLRKESENASQESSLNSSGVSASFIAGENLERMYALASQGSSYAYGPDEISHLIDCNKLINTATPALIVIAIIALASGIALRVLSGQHAFGVALVAAPAVLLFTMVALGLWAAFDFSGFFGAFHGLLFPQGNWTFPYDSLLICTLPTAFWIGMAAIWVVVTVGLSLVAVVLGRRFMAR